MKYSFVCCLEAGRLEAEVRLLLSTFRKYAGSLAESDFYVVQGRPGDEISEDMKEFLEGVGARYVYCPELNPYPWFNFSNKLAAVKYLEEHAGSTYCVWLDSDVIIAREPFVELLEGIDFAGRCEYLPPAVHVGNSKNEGYWRRVCELLGLGYENLPEYSLDVPSAEIKLFFNSGVMVWRRGCGFVDSYYRAFCQLLESKIASSEGSAWFADQVVLSPVVVRDNLRWQHLNIEDHHMMFQGHIKGAGAFPEMSRSAVIHYSKSFRGDIGFDFCRRIESEIPWVMGEVAAVLNELMAPAGSTRGGIVNFYRKLRLKFFQHTVRPVHD